MSEQELAVAMAALFTAVESAVKTNTAAAFTMIGIRAHLDALMRVYESSHKDEAATLARQIAIEESKHKQEIEQLNTSLLSMLALLQSSRSKFVM